MSAYRHQAHLDAPLQVVWDLVGTPARYPEWWPRVIDVNGDRFEEGDEWVQVTQTLGGKIETHMLLERRDDLRGIRMRCELTGTYAHWLLTPAQGGTFVELDLGMEPARASDRVFDVTMGRSYFRRWAKDSLAALEEASRVGGVA